MRKTRIALFLVLVVCQSHAQQDNLVLIDAENDQPFYARIGEKILNSSSIGHLSIPHLKDSTYILDIGFPENHFPEQKYSIRVNRRDLGFQLKNLGERGWALYNWQSKEMKMPISVSLSETHSSLAKAYKKDDPFSRLMAAVVNDSSVMYDTYSPSDLPKKDSARISATPIITANALTNTENPSTQVKKEPSGSTVKSASLAENSKEQKPVKRVISDAHPGIVKYREETTEKELKIFYVDVSLRGFADTITIIIAKEQDIHADIPVSNVENKPAQKITAGQPLAGANLAPKSSRKKPIPLPKCKSNASDYDIDVLRLNILSERTIDKRIAVAKKYFVGRCITTSQVRTLTELFEEDKDKFDFFKVTYPRVIDRENFSQLSSMLKGSQYVESFYETF